MHAQLNPVATGRMRPARAPAKSTKSPKSPLAQWLGGSPHYALLFMLGHVERIDAIKQGVPASVLVTLADDMHVTREQLFEWAGIPRATANRKIRVAGLLSQDEGERVLGLARLIGQVEQIVSESGDAKGFDAAVWTATWLSQPAPALGGARPGSFMDTADGRSLVSALIARMQSGAYA
jgi:putative toxin-antitoxin system antitoxin component (TIGR02293 family)